MPASLAGGFPQGQTGGVNNNFQIDGTNPVSSGALATPKNWLSTGPVSSVGTRYWIKFTDTGLGSGSATIIANNNVIFSMATPQFPAPTAGIGSRNFSYIIYDDAAGTIARANGAGNTDNSI